MAAADDRGEGPKGDSRLQILGPSGGDRGSSTPVALPTVHDRIREALVEAGADFNVSVRQDGSRVRFGVLNFPSLAAFHEALDARGLWASYSAGSGFTYHEREEGEM